MGFSYFQQIDKQPTNVYAFLCSLKQFYETQQSDSMQGLQANNKNNLQIIHVHNL